ncbi:MAG: sulfotransferase [Porticoccaceae bacterium]|nr:sulfotransferase [Porticoccaceae bacterium]
MANSTKLPDFIIIGAMKSATSTLHNQLSAQPGIFMSSPKEPNFFSDDDIYSQGLNWYSGLFSDASAEDICGESSTHYTKLLDHPETIQRLKEAIPQPKLIYVMRHPVDRLISHYMHQWSEGVISCDINQAIDRYPELVDYSCYGMQITPYLKEFGSEAVLPLFFDDLKNSRDRALNRVGEFIGCTEPLIWIDDLTQDNISSQRIRRFYGYELLVNWKPMAWVRKNLIPQTLRNRVKKQFTIQNRPEISAIQLERITEIFNRDLKIVRAWLGDELTCDSLGFSLHEKSDQ